MEGRVEMLYRHICDRCARVPDHLRRQWRAMQVERAKREEKRKVVSLGVLTGDLSGVVEGVQAEQQMQMQQQRRASQSPTKRKRGRVEDGAGDVGDGVKRGRVMSESMVALRNVVVAPSAESGSASAAAAAAAAAVHAHQMAERQARHGAAGGGGTQPGMSVLAAAASGFLLDGDDVGNSAGPRVSTRVVDTVTGESVAGVEVRLDGMEAGRGWKKVVGGVTDADGRFEAGGGVAGEELIKGGVYRLTFKVGEWCERVGREALFPVVEVQFKVPEQKDEMGEDDQFHIPLLLSG
ncbi:hypothetical protein HK101_008723, partial [Irineochytrium annulatum]